MCEIPAGGVPFALVIRRVRLDQIADSLVLGRTELAVEVTGVGEARAGLGAIALGFAAGRRATD
jgi:hypothetical protein